MSYENDPKSLTEELPTKPNKSDDEFLIARPDCIHEPLVASDELENNKADHNNDIKDDSSLGGFFSAIDAVEKLGYEGKLSSVQIAQMKHRFFKLSGLLSKIRDNEFNLIQLSKKMSIQLDSLNESLSKADNYPEGYNTKADKLREQLLNANNRLLQIEERNDELNYTIESLKDEKRMLENEYNRMPKEESESTEIQSQLLQTMKETDKLQKQKDEVERLKTETSDEQLKLQDEMKTLESLRLQLELESVKLQNQSTKKQKKLCDLQAQHEAVNIHVSELEQKNAEMTLQKTETDLKMDHLKQELLQLKDRINHQTRLHEAFIRKTRKADNILQALKESVKFTMKTCSEKHMNCLAMKQTGQNTQLLKKRTQLINDIKKLKEMLISQCQLTELEQTKLRQSLQQVDQMNYDLANLRIELVELTRLVTIKSDEREQKSREFLIAQSRYNRIQDDIKSKQLQINEYDKSLNSTQKKLKDFAHLYETVKEERNNCLNSIQLSNQHIQELGEKLRISANEIDILKNHLDHKEELLNKQRKNIEKVTVARDLLRNEFSKLSCTIKDNEAQKERMEQSIHRQNTIITQTTKQLEDLKNAIGHVIKLRDSRAIEIVERNEEFCVLQEKLNLQNFTLHKGEIEMNKLEDEIKSLQLIKNDIKRKNELLKKESEKSKKLKNEVQSSQLQLAVYQDRLAKLEKTAISPKAFLLDSETGDAIQKDLIKCKNHKNTNIIIYETRLNELNGKNENIAELKYKIDTLEIQIYSREKKLLELNLLLDAIQCLINKLEKQVNMGKDVALTLAVKTNEQKGTTVQTTKLLKATTAELTMLMTTAFDLEQQVKERRTFLKECYERMEAGNPPTDDVIEELEKYSRVVQWKSDRKRISKALELDDYWTTAPERPNAYLIHRDVSKKSYEYPPNTAPNHGGSDDQVSSPKINSVLIPYGAHAPFRPNDPSSHMRHFRKPELKPVDT
uniref:Coiled-coil domain-containing protein 150 n=1 Tax=Schistosoma mansoni TaxID=6183 RepID=A0A5K4FBQ2_SCHMA